MLTDFTSLEGAARKEKQIEVHVMIMNHRLKKTIVAVAILTTIIPMMAQTTLTFVGKDANGQQVPLDSVRITNLSRGWTEVLDASDLTLTMTNSGVDQHDFTRTFESA